jgi:hypothetical protein
MAAQNGGYRTLTAGVSITLCDRRRRFGRDALLLGEDPPCRWLVFTPRNPPAAPMRKLPRDIYGISPAGTKRILADVAT